ncbi:hypothetical protein [Rhizobium sp. AQ_MP]|uniref:hypothetical protein n=1 Tax=Rhizobium sp. AQ_MP TaxID=2761536 RepID=UPI001FEDCE33|nr:hypothetical protein [Rhizobium sp. AQ_MP]
MSKSSSPKFDVHQEITNRIVNALETLASSSSPGSPTMQQAWLAPSISHRASPIMA